MTSKTPKFDKKAYQRDYMRTRRAAVDGATPAPSVGAKRPHKKTYQTITVQFPPELHAAAVKAAEAAGVTLNSWIVGAMWMKAEQPRPPATGEIGPQQRQALREASKPMVVVPPPPETAKQPKPSNPVEVKRDRWTGGSDCPKCGFLLRAGRCSNRLCK
jgi:hypothetical protein